MLLLGINFAKGHIMSQEKKLHIRNRTAEFLIFTRQAGDSRRAHLEDIAPGTADFPVCCIAGFLTCGPWKYLRLTSYPRSADWEIGDTVGLETGGTGAVSRWAPPASRRLNFHLTTPHPVIQFICCPDLPVWTNDGSSHQEAGPPWYLSRRQSFFDITPLKPGRPAHSHQQPAARQ